MRKFTVLVFVMVAVLALSACKPGGGASQGVSSSGQAGEGQALQPQKEQFVAVEITDTLIEELEDAYRNQCMDDFIKAHPDFILEQVARVKSNTGNMVEDGELEPRLWILGALREKDQITAEEALINHSRLAQFLANYKNKTPDSIALLQNGSTVPVWLTVYRFDGESCFRDSYMGGLDAQDGSLKLKKESFDIVNEGLQETETEWILTYESNCKVRYPKFGYEAVPLTEETMNTVLLEGHDPSCVLNKTDRTEKVGKVACDIYEILNKDKCYAGFSYAVAPDLSRYYEVEQVNGNRLLKARVAAKPLS